MTEHLHNVTTQDIQRIVSFRFFYGVSCSYLKVFFVFFIFCLKTNVVWMSQHESNRKASFCLKYVVALKPMCMADNSSHPTIFLDLRTTTTDWSFRAMLYMALETLLSLTYFSAFEIQIVHPFRTIVYQSWFLAIPWITSYLVCNLARLQTY